MKTADDGKPCSSLEASEPRDGSGNTGYSTGMQRPLTIALVVDSLSNFSNGTANSAYQLARELTGRGNTVRLIGVGAPDGQYRAREQHIPVATWFAHRQQT